MALLSVVVLMAAREGKPQLVAVPEVDIFFPMADTGSSLQLAEREMVALLYFIC